VDGEDEEVGGSSEATMFSRAGWQLDWTAVPQQSVIPTAEMDGR
jgi:hypothetical protein